MQRAQDMSDTKAKLINKNYVIAIGEVIFPKVIYVYNHEIDRILYV